MLLNTPIANGSCVTMKLLSGDEIIGKLISSEGLEYRIDSPMKVILSPQGPILAPYIFTLGPDNKYQVGINKSTVVLIAPTHKDIASDFLAKNAGIVPAKTIPKLEV